MNLVTLQYFMHIAKYKNITRSAKHFFVSQSTLSRHIISLEEELGVKLFERDNRKLELTEAGKVFEADCELFIKHMETVIGNVQIASRGDAGALRITLPGALFPTLPTALSQIKKKFPSIQFVVESYDFNEIPNAVHHGVYNVGFTYDFAAREFEDLESVSLGEDSFSLTVSSRLYPEATREMIPQIVNSLPLILPSYAEPPFLKMILHKLQSISAARQIRTMYVNTSDSVLLDTSLGLGYSIMPTAVTKAKTGQDHVSYIDLEGFSARSSIVMLYRKEETSPLVLEFVEIVKSLCVQVTAGNSF